MKLDVIKPDWSKAPAWAFWWAVDENGAAYWHLSRPLLFPTEWFALHRRELDQIGYVLDWRFTLTELPPPSPVSVPIRVETNYWWERD